VKQSSLDAGWGRHVRLICTAKLGVIGEVKCTLPLAGGERTFVGHEERGEAISEERDTLCS
jgi:hypothetical protein